MPRIFRTSNGSLRTRSGGFVTATTGTPPTVRVLAASPVVDVFEGQTAVVRVELDAAIATDLTFQYTTENGTALSGTDYTPTTGTGTITAGLTYVDISIPTINRVGTNGTRSFTFTISNAVENDTVDITIATSTVTVNIADVTAAPVLPVLVVSCLGNQTEGTSIVFRVTASDTYASNMTFSYTTANSTAVAGVDYTTSSGTGTITSGSLFADFSVTTLARGGYQGARSFTFTISGGLAGGNALTLFTPSATGTILDSESPTGDHAYFDTLIARSDYNVGYSLRPVAGQPRYYPTGHPHAAKRNPYYQYQLAAGRSSSSEGATAGYGSHYFKYEPSSDTHPQAQDACRSTIPAWNGSYPLVSNINAAQTTLQIAAPQSAFESIVKYKSLLLDDEIVNLTTTPVYDTGAGAFTCTVSRAQNYTVAASHLAGITCKLNLNSLWTSAQFRAPLSTSDGNTYFITYDFYFTDEYMDDPQDYYKCYQFASNTKPYPAGNNWSEVQTRFMPFTSFMNPDYDRTQHVAICTIRHYEGGFTSNTDWSATCGLYPNSDSRTRNMCSVCEDGLVLSSVGSDGTYPMHSKPVGGNQRSGGFHCKPGKWVRAFFFYRQNLNNWDIMDIWFADDEQGVVHQHKGLRNSIGNPGSITSWWIELNTSQVPCIRPWAIAHGSSVDYGSPANLPPLVMYHRNFVMLKNPGTTVEDIEPLLVAPS